LITKQWLSEDSELVAAACGNCLTKVGELPQLAATISQKLDSSRSLQQLSHKNWRVPAACSNYLTKVGEFPQLAATVSQKLESCRSLQQLI
jgi:predicted transcriptional regulator